MFTSILCPRKGYDEYFTRNAEPRPPLKPLLPPWASFGIEEITQPRGRPVAVIVVVGPRRLNGSGEDGGERILP